MITVARNDVVATAYQRPKPNTGLSAYYLALELKRAFSQIATIFFCFALPVFFYLAFGAFAGDATAGRGNANAMMLVLMGVYASSFTAATMSIGVAHERPLGWNRQLRLTPLRPWAYIVTQALAAMIAGLAAIVFLYLVAAAIGKADMPAWMWFATLGTSWLFSAAFAALGLFVALSMKPETATAVIVPVMLACCFLSGVFMLPLAGEFFRVFAQFVPLNGIANVGLSFFGMDATQVSQSFQNLNWRVWANAIGWTVVFLAGAVLAYARDTQRQ